MVNDLDRLHFGNAIHVILNYNEGIDIAAQVEAVELLYSAIFRAFHEYHGPHDGWINQAYRHFVWNQSGVQSDNLGLYAMRTIGINHEWGLILRVRSVELYVEKFLYHFFNEVDYNIARSLAIEYSLTQMIRYKQEFINQMQQDFQVFVDIFGVSNIMSFHNNCYGRAYADMSMEYGFTTAKSRNELLIDGRYVTLAHFRYVYDSDWWTY
jgi:hypothetical protein